MNNLTGWIRVSKAVPTFTHVEHYEDEEDSDDFRSDLVLCLTKEGDIIQGSYWRDQRSTKIDKCCGFLIDEDLMVGIDADIDVVAWMPIEDAYPDWFIEQGVTDGTE